MEQINKKNIRDKKIVILFVIDFIISRYGFLGGTEKQLIDKINRMDKRRFRPVLVCLQKRYHNHIWDTIDCEKIVLHIYTLRSVYNFYKLYRLFCFIKSKRADIIEAVFFDSILISALIGKLSGVKNIITCRRDMGFWYNKRILLWLRLINKYTKGVLVNSIAIKRNVISKENIEERKIDVIYNGIDLNLIEVTEKDDLCREFNNIEEKCVSSMSKSFT